MCSIFFQLAWMNGIFHFSSPSIQFRTTILYLIGFALNDIYSYFNFPSLDIFFLFWFLLDGNYTCKLDKNIPRTNKILDKYESEFWCLTYSLEYLFFGLFLSHYNHNFHYYLCGSLLLYNVNKAERETTNLPGMLLF